MLARYHCTPWRDSAELLTVRQQLYQLPNGDDNEEHLPPPDKRQDAVDRILAWEERGEVPVPVNSTVLLVQAMQSDDARSGTGDEKAGFVVRMVYGVAILRFVTGICDALQDPRAGKQSMLQIAQLLQLPAQLVEARHAISHKELPSLVQLRLAAQLGMEWLWDWYWAKLDEVVLPPKDGESRIATVSELQALRVRLYGVLKKYLGDRRTEVKKKAKKLEAGKRAVAEVASERENEAECRKALLALLIDEKMIIPSDKRLGTPMDGAYLLWDDLLQRLSTRFPTFLPAFINHIVPRLTTHQIVNIATDPFREALCDWLIRILTSATWSKNTSFDLTQLQQAALEECLLSPSYWSIRLAKVILDSHVGDAFARDWRPVVDAFDAETVSDVIVGTDEQTSLAAPVAESMKVDSSFEAEDDADDAYSLRPLAPGWGVWNGYWERRPIGGSIDDSSS